MRQSGTLPQPPHAILVATDLSSHCDRALDRATQLAQQWAADLHVVHALRAESGPGSWWPVVGDKPATATEGAEQAERQIRHDLPGDPERLTVHVEEGDPASVILDVAARESCELVIVGTSDPGWGDIVSHTTTEQLLRRLPQSLLVVRARPREPYRRLLIGTDFTPESRVGLETAAVWFGDAELDLLHALDIPYGSMFLAAGREDEFSRLEHDAMASFLAEARLPEGARERIDARIAYGYPEALLSRHGRAHDVDLTVVGALTRGLMFHLLVGGNTARIVHSVPGDILMVRSAGDRS